MKRIIALVIAVMMLTGVITIPAAAAEEADTLLISAAPGGSGAIKVDLRIEGVKSNLYYKKGIEIEPGATVEDLMALVNELDEDIGIVFTNSTLGAYISEISGLAEFEYGGYSGWSFMVNGEAPTVGMGLVELKDKDSVVFYYGDPWGAPGMQYPVPDLSSLYTEGVIRFFSKDTEWDEEYNPALVINPVVAATVIFNGKMYITDEKGEIKIEDKTGAAGVHSLIIERYDEFADIPTVVRFAPDYEIYVFFADTPDGAWFDFPVEYCVRAGFFKGVSAAQNLFVPNGKTTMAQLVTVLGRIAGADVDVVITPWYQAALDWAVDNDIIAEDAFESGAYVTRETFIYMFYLTVALVGTYDMDVKADITVAVDFDEINEDYRDAVSWAVASGIISGMTSNELTIAPDYEITRAQVCQMLFNYFTGV